MSLVHLANACSHLQNASKARLGLTSVPRTKQLHALLISMQRGGYVSNVNIGGLEPPLPSGVSPVMSTNPANRVLGALTGHVVLSDRDDSRGKDREAGAEEDVDGDRGSEGRISNGNISTRRVWIGLKYWNQRPVLERMTLISKPTRRVWMGVEDMEMLIKGRKVGYTKGLRGIGEAIFVTTDRGIMDIRECVERRTGGMLLCRVNQPW